jgi:hypothetical protein
VRRSDGHRERRVGEVGDVFGDLEVLSEQLKYTIRERTISISTLFEPKRVQIGRRLPSQRTFAISPVPLPFFPAAALPFPPALPLPAAAPSPASAAPPGVSARSSRTRSAHLWPLLARTRMWGAPFFAGGLVGRGMEDLMRSTRGEDADEEKWEGTKIEWTERQRNVSGIKR